MFYGLDYTSFLSPQLSQSTQLAGTYTDFKNPFILDYKEDLNREYALRHQWTYENKFGAVNWQLDAGVEIQYGNNIAKNFGNVNGEKDTIRFSDRLKINRQLFFIQSQFDFKKWGMTLGMSSNQLEYNVNRVENAFAAPFEFNRRFDNELIPRLAIQYEWNSFNMTYGAISEGFSSPTLDEIRTNEGSINRNLEAERGRTYELGHKRYGNQWQLDFTTFYAALRETITTYTNPDGVVLFQNAGATNQLGIETGITVNWKDSKKGWFNHFGTRTSYTFYDFRFNNYSQQENDFSGNQLTGVPQHTINQMANFKFFRNLMLNLHFRAVSEVPLTDENDVYAAPYQILNTKLSYTLPFNQQELKLAAGVENLFDETYSLGNDLNAFGGRFYQPAPGRNYYFSIEWKL